MSDIEITGNRVRINGTEVELRHEVGDIVEHEGVILVRFDPPSGVTDETNVVGISPQGEKLWDIEQPEQQFRESFFKSIQKKDGDVLLKNWNSHEYRLNVRDGSIDRVGKWDR
ncbi:hypothetical protein EGH22_20150 [Halomicroarcula sp. F28]|uniref:hypothetical protein n=1 Tax=Haloarcula salinisoli TaxID=2487746 RepID=UPI001C732057|nr:hypothetical protein [Halomicroarcula salinisoli]MBX0288647.1 hypothetical protein [Halomicroarcula salinisoli]